MESSARGYLLIADITGYTDYMQASELEHARGILEGLFAAMLERLNSPFVLSNVQGDAILSHARAGLVSDGHAVIDTVEAVYFGFAHALEGMVRNTTCPCNACRNIANLDLKLLVHYGPYADHVVGGRVELAGPEVILVHRLMKNRITAETGIRAYAAFTSAAAEAIAVPDFFAPMASHVETVERFGPVPLRILDMQPLWQEHRARERVVVAESDDLWFPDIETDIPAPVDRVWYFLNSGDRRADWFVDALRLTRSNKRNGRMQVGTVDHCAHGSGSTTVFTFLDWQPHEHTTFDVALPLSGWVRETIFVRPIPGGTKVVVRTAKPATANALTQLALRALASRMTTKVQADWKASLEKLKHLVVAEAPREAVPLAASREDAINRAIAAHFAPAADAGLTAP